MKVPTFRQTLGFPPRRGQLGTEGSSRRPPSAGCADQRSAFPCLHPVSVYSDTQLRGPAGRGAPSRWLGPSRRPPSAGCAGPHRENCPEVGVPWSASRECLQRYAVARPCGPRCAIPLVGTVPPPAFGGLCRPEVGVPSRPRASSRWSYGSLAPLRGAVPVQTGASGLPRQGLTERFDRDFRAAGDHRLAVRDRLIERV